MRKIKNKGITLIALVITIIIIIIISGITLRLMTGSDGIFNRVKNAIKVHKISEEKEIITLACNELYYGYLIDKQAITPEGLQSKIIQLGRSDAIVAWSFGNENSGVLIITFSDTGNVHRLDLNTKDVSYIGTNDGSNDIPNLSTEDISFKYYVEENEINKETYTNKSIKVKAFINADKISNTFVLQKSSDGINWTYGDEENFSENGVLYIRAYDNVRYGAVAVANIETIDKTKPVVTNVQSTTKDIELVAEDNAGENENASGIIGYAITENQQEPTEFIQCSSTNRLEISISNKRQGTTYYAWVKDSAGNVSDSRSTQTQSIANPTQSNLYVDNTTWNGINATVTFGTSTGFKIQVTDTPQDENSWIESNFMEIETGNPVYARLYDGYNATNDYIAHTPELVYNVKFDNNGGSGTMNDMANCKYGTTYQLSNNQFSRTGYTFEGWATTSNGSKAYNNGSSFSNLTTNNNGNVILYAVWKETISASISTNKNELTVGTEFTYSASSPGAGINSGTIDINGVTLLHISNTTSVSGTISIEDIKSSLSNLEFLENYTVSINVTGNTGEIASSSFQIQNYTVSSVGDLNKLATKVNAGNYNSNVTVYQIQDINLNGTSSNQWTPIGNSTYAFSGIYDGGYKKIRNIYIDSNSTYKGFFGKNSGTIRNLVIDSGTLKVGDYSGSVCGYNTGIVERVGNHVNLYGYDSQDSVGGLIGKQEGSESRLSESYNKATITGNINKRYGTLSGIIGCSQGTQIAYCYNSGNVTADSEQQNVRSCGISDGGTTAYISCYNIGTITLNMNNDLDWPVAAGIGGQLHSGSVTNSFNTGNTIINTSQTTRKRNAGLSGYYGATYTNCYWLKSASTVGVCKGGINDAYTSDGIIGCDTEAEIKTNALTILGTTYYQADSNNVNRGYPLLKWESNVR